MKISEISIKRPVTVIMITLIVVLLGVVSLAKLRIDLYPDFDVPVAIVSTSYQGVGPEEVETLLTKPLEGALSTVTGLEEISSISSEGNSIVILEFGYDVDLESAALDMREKIDMVRAFLPDDASAPRVFKIDPNAMPIMTLALSMEDTDVYTLQSVIEDKVQSRIERIDGVASVNIVGSTDREVEILVDMDKLSEYGLSTQQFQGILYAENVNTPLGSVERGSKSFPARITGEYESVKEIGDIPLMLQTGEVIRISDVAEVYLKTNDASSINMVNDNLSLGLSITKQSDANTVAVAREISDELDRIESDVEGLRIETIVDSSMFIEKAVGNVGTSGLYAVAIAIVVLYLFLRNMRTTLIIAISIPVSIIATFSLIYFYGITLNMMTLGGLALGVGMLVDNSIVVLENIYRYRDMGHSRFEAAKEGAREVSMAVTASTLTTVAVFLPIVFVEGITSIIFKELALTVTFSLLSSLVVSLTLVPMLSSQILRIDHTVDTKKRFSIFDSFFNLLLKAHHAMVRKALMHKWITILVAVVLFAGSIFVATGLGSEFIPSMDEGAVSISLEMPRGTKLEETTEMVDLVLEKVEGYDSVELISTSIGSAGQNFLQTSSGNIASITLIMKNIAERNISSFDLADDVREKLGDIPGANIEVSSSSNAGFGAMMGSAISVIIKGDDLALLEEYSDRFVSEIRKVDGVSEVSSSIDEGSEELTITIDREKAAALGTTASQVSSQVRGLVYGTTVGRYKTGSDEINIVLRGEESIGTDTETLIKLKISTPLGERTLEELASSITLESRPVGINRTGQVRTVTVSIDISGRDLGSVSDDIETRLSDIGMANGYEYDITGQTEELRESFESLFMAFGLAVLLIYMIMASQFESLKYPFIIMFTVPLAFAGSILSLYATGRLISVTAIIGLIMLAGIVVNNGIVLIDYVNTLRGRGMKVVDALVEASNTRLRPILMTSLTTIFALVPMGIGIGEGSEMTAPLATVVIGGLMVATILTLVLIPAIYLVMSRKDVRRES